MALGEGAVFCERGTTALRGHAVLVMNKPSASHPHIFFCLPAIHTTGTECKTRLSWAISSTVFRCIPCPDSQGGRFASGVTSPLQRAEQRILHFSPLKRGRDPGVQTLCLPPGYPAKDAVELMARGGLFLHSVLAHTRLCAPTGVPRSSEKATLLGPRYGPRHSPTEGSYGAVFSCERDTP